MPVFVELNTSWYHHNGLTITVCPTWENALHFLPLRKTIRGAGGHLWACLSPDPRKVRTLLFTILMTLLFIPMKSKNFVYLA